MKSLEAYYYDLLRLLRRTVPLWWNLRIRYRVTLGTGLTTVPQLRLAVETLGWRIHYWSRRLMSRPGFVVSQVQQSLDLVVVTPENLGYIWPVTDIPNFYRKAKSFGLELCPDEIPLQLPLQCRIGRRKSLVIATELVYDKDGQAEVFVVRGRNADGEREIDVHKAFPPSYDTYFFEDQPFVFVLPRK